MTEIKRVAKRDTQAAGPLATHAGGRRATVVRPEMVGFRLLKLTNLLSRPFFGRFARQHELTLTEWVRSGTVAQSFQLLDEAELKAMLEEAGGMPEPA